jgi:hypothetical protein
MGIRKLGDIIVLDFTTHNSSTGAVQDTDLLPTCEIFEDDNDTAILTPAVTKRVDKTGNYRISIEATIGNGFEIGKSYNVIISATVNDISAKSRIDSFVLDSKRINDLNDLSQSQILSDSTPFAGVSVDLIKTEVDKIQPDIIDNKDAFKADVSLLALEATSQLIKGLLENGSYGLDTIKNLIESIDNSTELQARFDEIKGAGWTAETLKAIKEEINSLDLELDDVAKDSTVAKEATLIDKASQSSVNAIKLDTESIISTLSTLVADVWSYTTRTITAGGITVAEIWGYITRTLTLGTKDSEIDSIKNTVETINTNIGTPHSSDIATDIENIQTVVDEIKTEEDLIKIETDKIKFILGLSQENYKLFDIVYSGDLITSTTIKTYPTPNDCENNTNPLATYNVTATYDVDGKLLTYKVKKV